MNKQEELNKYITIDPTLNTEAIAKRIGNLALENEVLQSAIAQLTDKVILLGEENSQLKLQLSVLQAPPK
jgi:hypothetical protein